MGEQKRTPGPLGFLLDIDLGDLPDGARLMIHAQNPANNYHWTKTVGVVTAGEVRAAVRVQKAWAAISKAVA